MNRRQFITTGGSALAGMAYCGEEAPPQPSGVPLDLGPLGYDFDALEPFIDTETMKIHYTKHHASYVANLRCAMDSVHLEAASAISLLHTLDFLTPKGEPAALQLKQSFDRLPDDVKLAIRNNGGGHVNHTLFWRYMAPPGTVPKEPRGKLAEALQKTFGGLDSFKKAFSQAAMKHFGSGWAWLAYRKDAGLFVCTTPNQDNPMMKGIVPEAEYGRPILCLDLWEHAYYLKYQNRRADYIDAWWNLINWPRVERSFAIVTTTSA
jgi:Fe-Mn family superoxide dismutase